MTVIRVHAAVVVAALRSLGAGVVAVVLRENPLQTALLRIQGSRETRQRDQQRRKIYRDQARSNCRLSHRVSLDKQSPRPEQLAHIQNYIQRLFVQSLVPSSLHR